MSDTTTDTDQFRVVVNHEEQYSVWPAGLEAPAGWHAAGVQGTRAECLAHIDEVWTDMRPLSLRRHMDAEADTAAASAQAAS